MLLYDYRRYAVVTILRGMAVAENGMLLSTVYHPYSLYCELYSSYEKSCYSSADVKLFYTCKRKQRHSTLLWHIYHITCLLAIFFVLGTHLVGSMGGA